MSLVKLLQRIAAAASILFISPDNLLKAQTSGPSTPEIQKFTPNTAKQMVNLFTGDLNYNISLLELDGGYPINISYCSAIGMTEEASAVGFGWQLNIGRINRSVRGLPDDFNGDPVVRTMSQEDEWTIGIGAGVDGEIFGFPTGLGASLSGGITFSNLRGVDLATNLGVKYATDIGDTKLSAGLNLGVSSSEGASISPNVGLQYKDFSLQAGASFSPMEGIKQSGFQLNYNKVPRIANTSFPLTMARAPFTPKIDFPVINNSGTFKFRFGGEIWGFSGGVDVYGNIAVQHRPMQTRSLNSFGYLYLQNQPSRNSIMDIGTEKESPVFAEDKNLSITYLANDVFSVSAQGLSGTFRPFRTDVGIIHNENINANSVGGSFGGEVHTGGYAQIGIDVTANLTNTYSGVWSSGNELSTICQFGAGINGLPVYFKDISETTGFTNNTALDALGGTNAASFSVGESVLQNSLNGHPIQSATIRKSQAAANNSFQFLTALEDSQARKPLVSYIKQGDNTVIKELPRFDNVTRKAHHISRISITKDDGTVYEFGIAAYNNIQEEVSFNVNANNENKLFDKTIGYNPGVDDSPQNVQGLNHYFTRTETPAYAYAYLLTAVYSPDYVDLTGDGPTRDDLGTYTRFNYTLDNAHFKWRTPYKDASYNAVNLCDKGDDMASYVYGEKEIWTIHSIETKNYVAEFFSSSRDDSYEVRGEQGSIDASGASLKKIDYIKLYSTADFNGPAPVPIKTIFFTYDYSLCPGLPASKTGEGKLTLKKVAIQYDKSQKETQSYYTFKYNNEKDQAFGYNETALDVWGNYKKIKPDINNVRFPYALQNKIESDETSKAWCLSRITLPSGGSIGIEYEAKDYAFVQNKQAMQMYRVRGFMKGGSKTDNLYNNDGSSNKTVIIDLGKDVSTLTDFSNYFRKGEKIYINCVVSAGNSTDINKETASGYFDVDFNSIKHFGNTQPSWITIDLTDPGVNPISHSLWQKMRKNLTHVLNPPVIKTSASITDNVMSVIGAIPSQLGEIIGLFKNYESKMMEKVRGNLLDNQYASFARLYNPDGRKIGGGSRVKKILLFDNWDKMTEGSGNAAVYGQEYSYSMQLNGSKGMISSGVATYEPTGNEENPFIIPSGGFNGANPLAPELYYYKTEPFGESFFPAASVGYSRVTVSELHDNSVTKNTTGFETYEYYTARDYPVITARTAKQGIPVQSINPFSSLKKYTASQGYYIEINDMHGKLKAHKVFSALDDRVPISGVEYVYRNANGQLNNIVPVINSASGTINHTSQVGIDYDFNIAADETRSLVKSPALQLNVDIIPALLGIPFPVPSFLPFYSENLLQYRGVTTTKILYRTGLIDNIIAYDNGISTSTKNILYDDQSGQVIVSSINNEFNQPQFKTNLPAHWFYDGMGPASLNANRSFVNFSTANVDQEPLLREGDQLLLVGGNVVRKGWIFKNVLDKKSAIDESGNLINGTFSTVRILRSGQKNMQGVSAGSIISSADPSIGSKLSFVDGTVLDASATEFNEYWQSYYAIHPSMPRDSCSCKMFDWNLNSYKIIINNDGTIRRPISASIQLSEINDVNDKCGNIKITLDKGFTNWETCFDSAEISFRNFKPIKGQAFCSSTKTATADYIIQAVCNGQTKTIQSGSSFFSGDCELITCHDLSTHTDPLSCNIPTGTAVNPYMLGILGNWRPKTTYHYITERSYAAGTLLQDQGAYKNFALCSTPVNGFLFGSAIDKTKWQPKSKVVVTDPHGETLESLDALRIAQTQLIGYGYTLPVATAVNANYYEIACDGFEDYDYLKAIQSPLSGCAIPPHFKFESITGESHIDDKISHSGTKSLWVAKNSPVTLERTINNACRFPFERNKYDKSQYFLDNCDIVKQFSPVPGKEYVISCWVNEQRSNNDLDASQPLLKLEFRDAQNSPINTLLLGSKGSIIDNWQLLNENFAVPDNAAKVSIQLFNSNAGMFVDDIRIQPFNSSMKTYVYDPVKLRLMAILDEQNFATFYEYDKEGQLTREKKETERGVMTVKEIRSAKPKTDKLGF